MLKIGLYFIAGCLVMLQAFGEFIDFLDPDVFSEAIIYFAIAIIMWSVTKTQIGKMKLITLIFIGVLCFVGVIACFHAFSKTGNWGTNIKPLYFALGMMFILMPDFMGKREKVVQI